MKPKVDPRFLRILSVIIAATLVLVGIIWFLVMTDIGGRSGNWEVEFEFLAIFGMVAIVIGILLLRKFNIEPHTASRHFGAVRVNVLCLMGAVLGLFCAFEWGLVGGGYRTDLMQVDWAFWPPMDQFAPGEVYSWLFVLGTILSFFTPAAGFLQLGGITVFAFQLHDTLNGPAGSGTWSVTGYVAAIVATSIVVVSLAFPYGVGYRGRPVDILGRLLTISSPTLAEKITAWRRHEIQHSRSTDSHQ